MSAIDQKQFTDAVAKAKAPGSTGLGWIFGDDRYSLSNDWVAALQACNRLAMFDMLPALDAILFDDRRWLLWVEQNKHVIGEVSLKRIAAAKNIVELREIQDDGLPDGQVNDGRQFLGCTRLDDAGVQNVIDDALNKARPKVAAGIFSAETCCGVYGQAWAGRVPGDLKTYDPDSLVGQRRAYSRASLVSNLAAAAHYMLARYHVCAAKATKWQMNLIIDGYDEKKRGVIANGDRDLSSSAIALTPRNPAFPPDFAITQWAKKGSLDGEADYMRCNSSASVPLVIPMVSGKEWGLE